MKSINLLLFMLCAIACGPGKDGGDDTSESSSGSTGATSTDPPTTGATVESSGTEGEPGLCVAATPGSPAVPECELDFCPPASKHIVAHDDDGAPGLKCNHWSGFCNSSNDDYQAFMFESEDLVIYLSFDPQLERSDASFKANFKYLWAQVEFPPDPTDHSHFYEQTEDLSGLEIFDSFAFADGRLKASLQLDVDRVWQRVASNHPECVAGDIAGQCSCTYTGLAIPVTIDIDLAVEP
ncbi:hypothetical protein [Nannocystis pusilla]|uniref:Lipoprotein n=1 Tax=Nannocystis pusilla TaxID=889268 RepID=A0ABS7U5P8_9BACT|nr:hypothetical protein [Nannocystis pusilla]MBZ5715853.1 hypothetical protein [Nannocystis pusilla]